MFTQGQSGNVKGTAPGKAKTLEEKFPQIDARRVPQAREEAAKARQKHFRKKLRK